LNHAENLGQAVLENRQTSSGKIPFQLFNQIESKRFRLQARQFESSKQLF
jgi:hypothetical protein